MNGTSNESLWCVEAFFGILWYTLFNVETVLNSILIQDLASIISRQWRHVGIWHSFINFSDPILAVSFRIWKCSFGLKWFFMICRSCGTHQRSVLFDSSWINHLRNMKSPSKTWRWNDFTLIFTQNLTDLMEKNPIKLISDARHSLYRSCQTIPSNQNFEKLKDGRDLSAVNFSQIALKRLLPSDFFNAQIWAHWQFFLDSNR